MSTSLASDTMRGSSNQQDAAGTTAEMAVQARPPRSILKSLTLRQVMPSVVHDLIEEKHYLHAMPAAPRRCYGVYLSDVLHGAVVFTSGPRQGHRLLTAAKPQEVSELARLWLGDTLPPNSESRVLGVVLQMLRRETTWKLLLSYADPAVGHRGTIYQAVGWLYLGETEPNSYVRLADGALHHPRSVYTRYGSNNIGHLRATGVSAVRETTCGKHRYAYVLDPAWRWRLRGTSQPYPKRQWVMARPRDYKAEYARRVARGEERGLSRRQARGHPGREESSVSGRRPPRYDRRLEEGLKAVRDGKTLRDAARSINAAPETLRTYLVRTGVAEKRSNRWRIGTDRRNRVMQLFSGGKEHVVTVDGYDAAFHIGRYMAAVSQFLASNDASLLQPFVGQSVADVKGRRYVFETRPNVLYRLSQSRNESFEQVYRIVI